MEIRKAADGEFTRVWDFYGSLIDTMEHAEFKPGWEREVYPTRTFLRESIENGELYVGELDGQLASCMVLNHQYNDGYREVPWSVEATDAELLVLHALGVHPSFAGRGVAKQMVEKAQSIAAAENVKTIRLDVLEGNLPAEKTYVKMGFRYLTTLPMYYEDTGWTNFKVFEYILPPK